MFPNGKRPKTGGRPKGTPNRTQKMALEIIQRFAEKDPLEVLCYIMDNNEKALGYNGPKIKMGREGVVLEEPWITPEMRMEAAKQLARKIYPDLKAVELSSDDENPVQMHVNLTSEQIKDLVKAARGK